jgi:hypothetical protein
MSRKVLSSSYFRCGSRRALSHRCHRVAAHSIYRACQLRSFDDVPRFSFLVIRAASTFANRRSCGLLSCHGSSTLKKKAAEQLIVIAQIQSHDLRLWCPMFPLPSINDLATDSPIIA